MPSASPSASPFTLSSGWVIAFVLSFGPTVSNSFARFAYALVLPAMREDLTIHRSQAGTLGTTNAIGNLVGALRASVAVTRLRQRRILAAGRLLHEQDRVAAEVGRGLGGEHGGPIAAG